VTVHASLGRMPDDHNPPGGISTRLISLSADPADSPEINDYDSFAEAYAAETEANLINGYYTRPAMLALAGDVAGTRILDAGCGAGPLSEALRDRGALVTGIDKSAGIPRPIPHASCSPMASRISRASFASCSSSCRRDPLSGH
jgi:predicted TPR repeat methyltransferase